MQKTQGIRNLGGGGVQPKAKRADLEEAGELQARHAVDERRLLVVDEDREALGGAETVRANRAPVCDLEAGFSDG